ncbi:phosphatase PAP2 family protein [Candidatus Pacearchaeota archaeon]|nr:phosphatase PAP2 family protein [Candidatus Pacearchaeota archaeon]
MLSVSDLVNILLPVLSHWILWLIFVIMAIIILFLYAYPYIKKPRKEFRSYHIGIPITNVVSMYIFTKMLEGVIYGGSILKVDAWVNKIIFNIYFPWIDKIALFVTTIGSTWVIVSLFVIALTVLILRKRWRYALLSTIALSGALILQLTIKFLVHRTRPQNLIETYFSFPSGHAITAVVFVSLLIYSFKDDFKNKTVKYILIVGFSIFFISIGASRIILQVHWFSDVIAGWSLGLFWFMLVVLVERSITGLIQAVRKETKEAKPIVPKEVTKIIEKGIK